MQRLRLRVPGEDGSILSVPSLQEWAALAASNHDRLAEPNHTIGPASLHELRRVARQEALEASARYLTETPANDDVDAPFIVTGHQPELYHPGVWIKNFAARGLTSRLGGVALHVLIDNDTIKRTQIALPAGDPSSPVLTFAPFDHWEHEIPFEEREVADEETFARFPDAVAEQMRGFDFAPIAPRLWQKVMQTASANLGDRISAGRRRLEREMGCVAAETPLSHLCQGDAFRTVTADVLLRLDSFLSLHNRSLGEYRRLNKVRSRHHPVPELEQIDGWLEGPFWLWSRQSPRRRRLFVRQADDRLDVRAGDEQVASLRVSGRDPLVTLAESLRDGLGPWKLRPRALMTTLFLRLLVADLFIHGVGGGKYDELTDELIRRFYGIEPPAFAILSATLRLPDGVDPSASERLEKLQRLRRDMTWNPDRYIDEPLRDQDPIASWIERKYELRDERPNTPERRRARFLEFRGLNEQLEEYLGAKPRDVDRKIQDVRSAIEASSVLKMREFAYCVHPWESLSRLYEPMLHFKY